MILYITNATLASGYVGGQAIYVREFLQSYAGARAPPNIANVGLGEDEDQGRDTLTYQPFKTMFPRDDSDPRASSRTWACRCRGRF